MHQVPAQRFSMHWLKTLVAILSILVIWACYLDDSEARRYGGGGGGGGFRQPTVRTSFNNAARAPMTPRFNTASGSGARTVGVSTPLRVGGGSGGGGSRVSLPLSIKPTSRVAALPSFKGQITKAGSPIVQVRGKNWAIPQHGAINRGKLLSGTSSNAISINWTERQRTKIAEIKKSNFTKKVKKARIDREKIAAQKLRFKNGISPVAGAIPGDKTRNSSLSQWDKKGGYDQANKDFDDLKPKNVQILRSSLFTGRIGTLSDGRKIVVRSGSKGNTGKNDGWPTLDFHDGELTEKVRYDPDT